MNTSIVECNFTRAAKQRWLTGYMEQHRLTQERLAESLDYNPRHVRRWLSDDVEIPRAIIYAIRYLYG